MVQDHFWKNVFFSHFLTHYWSHNGPFLRHLGVFHGPNLSPHAQNMLKNFG